MLKRKPETPRTATMSADATSDPPVETPAWVADRLDAQRWSHGGISRHNRAFPEETPVAFVINDEDYAVMLATPADIRDFAYGFLLTEGVIAHADEVDTIDMVTRPQGLIVHVQLVGTTPPALRQRRLAGASSCGLCGVDALRDVIKPMARVAAGPCFPDTSIHRAMAALPAHQPYNAVTGATHAAAFAAADTGEIRCSREDVGRHNALDKVIGALLRAGTDPATGFVVTTSRCSYELIQKSAAFGLRLLCTASAPTALSVRLAREANLSLVSLVHDDAFLVLAGADRILPTEALPHE